jgi:hypothetical protein
MKQFRLDSIADTSRDGCFDARLGVARGNTQHQTVKVHPNELAAVGGGQSSTKFSSVCHLGRPVPNRIPKTRGVQPAGYTERVHTLENGVSAWMLGCWAW